MLAIEILLCWLTADVISGLFHWAEDTWLSPGNGILDSLVTVPNIEHHRNPSRIAKGTYWETNRVSILLASCVAAGAIATHVEDWHVYMIILFSSHLNQVHAWAHSGKVPAPVKALQSIGLLQSAAQHAHHHKRPFDSHYCTATNWLNPTLNYVNVWRALEWIGVCCGLKVMRGSQERGYN